MRRERQRRKSPGTQTSSSLQFPDVRRPDTRTELFGVQPGGPPSPRARGLDQPRPGWVRPMPPRHLALRRLLPPPYGSVRVGRWCTADTRCSRRLSAEAPHVKGLVRARSHGVFGQPDRHQIYETEGHSSSPVGPASSLPRKPLSQTVYADVPDRSPRQQNRAVRRSCVTKPSRGRQCYWPSNRGLERKGSHTTPLGGRNEKYRFAS